MRVLLSCVSPIASALLLWPVLAAADGALAVGQPADPKQGFSYGIAWDVPREEARARALARCRGEGAPQAAAALCRVIETFANQCVAVALDPGAGRPGVGWAIGASQEAAEGEALRKCQETAQRGRRRLCRVISSRCDGRGAAKQG